MRGHIARKGTRYYPVIDLGQQVAQRCTNCRWRTWVDRGRYSICAKCGGTDLVEREERRQAWHGGSKTRKEAQRTLTEHLAKLDGGIYVTPSRQALGAFLRDEWLPAVRSTIRPSTWASYEMNIEKHVLPSLGSMELRHLSPSHLNALYADLLKRGHRDGGGLSARSVRYVHVIIRKALKDAMRWGRVGRNVADLADPPKQSTPELRVWGRNQLQTFLARVSDDRLSPLYLLAVTTGMRRGELLGLRWIDVDLNTRRLQVRQTLIVVNNRVQVSQPKTARSRRSIALDSGTVAALRSHRARQLEEHMAWGPAYEDSGLVFTQENGCPIHPQALSSAFQRHAKAAKLLVIPFHSLRHSYATLALSNGIHPKVVSDRLGHSNIAVTLDTYSHVLEAVGEQAATRVASLIIGR